MTQMQQNKCISKHKKLKNTQARTIYILFHKKGRYEKQCTLETLPLRMPITIQAKKSYQKQHYLSVNAIFFLFLAISKLFLISNFSLAKVVCGLPFEQRSFRSSQKSWEEEGPFLFLTYLGRSKGLCSQGICGYDYHQCPALMLAFSVNCLTFSHTSKPHQPLLSNLWVQHALAS